MKNDPRYEDINNVQFPACSRAEADKAVKAIVSKFGRMSLGSANMTGDVTWPWPARRCWLASKPTKGHHRGWGRMIHDLGHIIFHKRHPTFRSHAGGHATLEREILIFCQTQGFLDGRLKPAAKRKLSRREKLLTKSISLNNRLTAWQRKFSRAENAIKKLKRQLKTNGRELAKEGWVQI